MTIFTPCHRRRSPLRRPVGGGGRSASGNPRPRFQARHRPALAGGAHARPVEALRRDALRTGGAGAVGPRRHAAGRDRSNCSPTTTSNSPSSRWTYRPLLGGERGQRHHRRRAGRQPLRPAPVEGRCRARPYPRHQRRFRPRRGVQVGRARGQERHRLRPVQADGRQLGHAGRVHRRHLQGAARRRDRDDARRARPARRCTPQPPWRWRWARARKCRARPICPSASPTRIAGGALGSDAATLLRVEGFGPSVAYRIEHAERPARERRRRSTRLPAIDSRRSGATSAIARRSPTAAEKPVWRVSMAPAEAHQHGAGAAHAGRRRRLLRLAGRAGLAAHGAGEPEADVLRALLRKHGGGHATLVRATPADARRACPSSSRSRRRLRRSSAAAEGRNSTRRTSSIPAGMA